MNIARSQPIAISHSPSKMVYLLIGQETDQIHAITYNKRYCMSLLSVDRSEDCCIKSADELGIELDLIPRSDLHSDSKSGGGDTKETLYVVFHVKEFMGISQSLGNGVLDTNRCTARLITDQESKAKSYLADNTEYASGHDEKITYKEFLLG